MAALVDELARRFGEGPSPARLTLRDLDDGARQAIADLLGEARVPPATYRLSVDRLCAGLHLAGPEQLRAAVEALRGPLGDRRAAAAAARTEREELWRWLEAEAAALRLDLSAPFAAAFTGPRFHGPEPPSADPGSDGTPGLWPDTWLTSVRRAGIRGSIESHRRRLAATLAVLRTLPADGVALPVLAARVLGDAHALDPGRSVTALVLDALATRLSVPGPGDAESARQLWEAAGVVPDPLSSTVLVLGLRSPGEDPVARMLRDLADAGEPAVLTLAQRRRWPVAPLASGAELLVVENPAIVAEAVARGHRGCPLVCSSGRPTLAVVLLLRQLAAGGAALHQHADFDPAGVAITQWLAERAGTIPWRMTAADYREAVSLAASTLPAIAAAMPPTPWDPPLQAAMTDIGRAVHEESIVDDLLGRTVGSGPQ